MRRWLVVGVLALAGAGWRGDGTGVVVGGAPPWSWAADDASCWRVPLPTAGNSSPVVVDGRVYVATEPDGIEAFDAASGRRLWAQRLDVTRAFDPATAAELAARLTQAGADEAALKRTRDAYARLQRDARRADAGPEVLAELDRLGKELASLRARLDAVAPYTTSRDLGWIGYASATPLVAGGRVFAVAGHGVVGAFDLDGRPVWTRWLGKAHEPMRGWLVGHATSPVLADGVLVVGFGRLRGLDPATGRELWVTGGPWDHFGTPAVVRVGGREVVVTPGGDVVRPSDGKVLAQGLGSVYHVGPVVHGDVVVIQGNTGNTGKGGLSTGHRLVPSGDGVRAERLWWTELPELRNVAGGPVVHGGAVWSFELEAARPWRVELGTGRATAAPALEPRQGATYYASPVLVGSRVLLAAETGHVTVVELGAGGPRVVGESVVDGTRATPWVDGRRLFVHGLHELRCYTAR